MEKVIITRPHETVANLAELANQIKVEHGHVETAIRDGLAHAKKAGKLLLQAKARLSHGNWLPWIERECKVSSRTAQRYVQVAEHWEEIIGKGGKGLGLRSALKLLSHQSGEPSNTTRVSHLPAALAYYRDNGFLDDDSLRQVLDLEKDYGPEILTELRFDKPWQPEYEEGIWLFLNVIRPLDNPPMWPYPVNDETAAARVLIVACKVFFEDGRARAGKVPQWELAAFWFASTIMHLADRYPKVAENAAAELRHGLEIWRESFRAALMVMLHKELVFKKPEQDWEEKRDWVCYMSDLRHAGVLGAAKEMLQDPAIHPTLHNSLMAGIDDFLRLETYPHPSCMQGRLKKLGIDDGEDESEQMPDGDPDSDAWEHPEDRISTGPSAAAEGGRP